jgi:hypothetical protein
MPDAREVELAEAIERIPDDLGMHMAEARSGLE